MTSELIHAPAATASAVSDYLDIVAVALGTVCRRLPAHVVRDDLASVGKLALIKALAQAQGTAEEIRAYCFVRVRGSMLDELRRMDPLSRRLRENLGTVLQTQAELGARLARAPTRAEIAAATRLSLPEVAAAQSALTAEAEFVETPWDSLPDTDTPSPADFVESADMRLSLRSALERLSSAQACVLYRYYFDDVTLEVIAGEMGLSKERVRQIRDAGEKKLRADFAVLAIWQSLIASENPLC